MSVCVSRKLAKVKSCMTPVGTSACGIRPRMPHFGDFRVFRVIFILLQVIFYKILSRLNDLSRLSLVYLPTSNQLYIY